MKMTKKEDEMLLGLLKKKNDEFVHILRTGDLGKIDMNITEEQYAECLKLSSYLIQINLISEHNTEK